MGDVVLLLNYVGHPGEYQLCCHHGSETTVVTLDGVDVSSCGETWLESGVELSFVETTDEDCGQGSCYFGLSPDGVLLYPARLDLDIGALAGIVTEAWVDIVDWCGTGCTRAFLYNGTSIVDSVGNQAAGEETMHLVNAGETAVDRIAVSSCEGAVLEIRLELVTGTPSPEIIKQ